MTDPVWQEAGWTPLPPLSGDAVADVCVVGLGIAGLSAAVELAGRGRTVIGLDAVAVGAGASGRNGGFLLGGLADFHHVAVTKLGRDRATALYRLTLDELERSAELAPEAVRRTGSLRIAWDEAELRDCEAQLAAMRADRLPVEPYEGPEGQGLRFPRDAATQPLRRVRAIARHALTVGARLHEHTPAQAVAPHRVSTSSGTVECGHVLVCLDGGLERVVPELAERRERRLRTARAQMLATAPDTRTVASQPVYARWGYDYWQQLPDGRVVLGGCRDRGGDDEWTHDVEPTPLVQGALDVLLRERLGVTAPVTHRWAGIIGYGDGMLPLLEVVDEGVVALGGYSGTGNLVGAVLGRAAARLVTTGQTGVPSLTPV